MVLFFYCEKANKSTKHETRNTESERGILLFFTQRKIRNIEAANYINFCTNANRIVRILSKKHNVKSKEIVEEILYQIAFRKISHFSDINFQGICERYFTIKS